jgi:hypothetical protein
MQHIFISTLYNVYGEVALFLHAFDGENTVIISPLGKEAPRPFGSMDPEDWTENLCSWELNCWFCRCSAGGLAIVLLGQLYVSVRHEP